MGCLLAHTMFQDELSRYFPSAIKIITTRANILLLILCFIEKKMGYMETGKFLHHLHLMVETLASLSFSLTFPLGPG